MILHLNCILYFSKMLSNKSECIAINSQTYATVIQLFTNTGLFYRLEYQFRKKLNIKCKEFQIILQMIAMEINLTIKMTYLLLKTRIVH